MNEYLKYLKADVQQIYSRINDDISRKIFESRLLATLIEPEKDSDEIEFLQRKRNNDKRLKELFDKIKQLDGNILIYGAGECGRYLCNSNYMKGISVQGFIDNKKWYEGSFNDIPIYSFEEAVKQFEKANIILSMQSNDSRWQIKAQIANRRRDWKIIDAGEVLQEIDKERLLELDKPYYKYIYDLVNTSEAASELFNKLIKSDRLFACWITFREGDEIGRLIKEKWGYYPWQYYLTNDKKRNEYNGIPVYTYEEAVNQYGKLDIVIESRDECEIAREKISAFGTEGECIDLIDITEDLSRKQYFDFFSYSGMKETFVDGGVFDLGSTKEFMKWCRGNYERIFAFEPEKDNYELCKERLGGGNWNSIRLFNCGLFDRQGEIGFTSGLGSGSCIEDQKHDLYADYNIKVMDLDSVVEGEQVTFIKMDIEGAEEKALLGAKRTITEQKPKLAICVYHKPEDIIELPALVLAMRPDYNIAFRHYSLSDIETVMYAW